MLFDSTACAGLQPRQLPTDPGAAQGGQATVADDTTRQADLAQVGLIVATDPQRMFDTAVFIFSGAMGAV